MQKRCFLKAPAKLNLHLQIGERRTDGFHDINSLFVMVDLFDEINARSLKSGNDCRIRGNFNCAVEDNLIYKAWIEFCRVSGKSFGIEFDVQKRIPSFAGLGGGSSDAAAALKAMNLLFETGFTDKQLSETGAVIGSDVPFFIEAAAAVTGGRGERIKKTDPVENHFVLIHPGFEISTGKAYGWVDEDRTDAEEFMTEESILKIYNGNKSLYKAFSNDFTPALTARYEEFSEIFRALDNEGSVYSNITGSGSAVFGLFKSSETAENAQKNLENRYKFVQKIKSLDRIPYAILE